MNPFKPGDIVVCIDNKDCYTGLELGGHYIIESIKSVYVRLQNVRVYNVNIIWHYNRFVKCNIQLPKEDVPNFIEALKI